jgi:hypothetical protein
VIADQFAEDAQVKFIDEAEGIPDGWMVCKRRDGYFFYIMYNDTFSIRDWILATRVFNASKKPLNLHKRLFGMGRWVCLK